MFLGLPWLLLHNPSVDWLTRQLYSDYCSSNCFTSASALVKSPPMEVDLPPPDLSGVPECYHDLKEVFTKAKATSLLLHRPYDCVIDCLPSASRPKVRLYSLSSPKTQAMRDSIQSSLVHPEFPELLRTSSTWTTSWFSPWTFTTILPQQPSICQS